jgi:diacylglycerol O-acyltransferase / wax synthase
MQRLGGIDSMFVSLESPTNLFHVGAVAVLDPSTAPAGSPPPHEALRRVMEKRIHRIHPLRKKLVAVPGGIDHPRWIEDPNLDLDRHLHRGALPSPGGERELTRFAADVLSRPLDRRHPLWEIHSVEGLEGGLFAGVAKLHHSTVDGIAGTEVTAELMDLTPEVRDVGEPDEELRPEPVPSPVSLLRDAFVNAGKRTIPTLRGLGDLSMAAMGIRSRNRRQDAVAPPSLFSSPRTRLAASVGAGRAVGLAQIDRADVDEVRAKTGAKVNDVILAVTSSALRRYLKQHDELPEEELSGFVPISVRSESDNLSTGVNRLSGMLVSLATNVSDPIVRLLTMLENTRNAKEQAGILGPEVFSNLSELAVPALLAPAGWFARVSGLTRMRPPFSIVVSSFPGPPFPLYCGGAEMLAYYPFGPVIDGAALNITAMSYRDQIGFGLLADRDALPDVDALARMIPDSMGELKKAVTDAHRST